MIYVYWTFQVLFFLIWIYCLSYLYTRNDKDDKFRIFALIGAIVFGLLTFYWNDTIAQLTGQGFI